ncbi:MAG: pyrroline-5-carboxylate reductase [Deltaproteobacteria bacterium]|nr:pyrroline-5-carboxylate reductase [Deltaproteobacteria bacterium]
MLKNKVIGFIGAGNMAEALINGLISSHTLLPGSIMVSDRNIERLAVIAEGYKIKAVNSNTEVVSGSDIVIMAVKPQDISSVLAEVRGTVKDKLLISIAAGIKTATIIEILLRSVRIVRAMPNTPALVLSGATALFVADGCSKDDEKLAVKIFDAVGKTVVLKDEALMDAVTGLSGSGPAYVFVILEALADAGVRMGLPRETASLLANQTVFGAAKMVMEVKRHPAELKDMVASPGGTTIAGLKKLEDGKIRASLMDAVEAATLRSRELSNG